VNKKQPVSVTAENLISLGEAAVMLGSSMKVTRKYVREGTIASVRIGRRIKVPQGRLIKFIKRRISGGDMDESDE
jgi:excisionase family DNA binding protein